MPTSHLYQLNEISELIVLTAPASVLDIGPGFGKFGFLTREYLDIWEGRYEPEQWRTTIDCIEVYGAYITPVHRHIYNTIFEGEASTVLRGMDARYDLILCVDVLEHFDSRAGAALLELCLERARNLIVSTPHYAGSQSAVFGNPFEAHVSQWTRQDFDRFTDKFIVPNDYSFICYLGRDANRVREQHRYITANRMRLAEQHKKSLR